MDGIEPPGRLSERRIARCFLCQNYLLRLFANRDWAAEGTFCSLFSDALSGGPCPPARPVLPDLFARAIPEHRNPFSDSFMNGALTFKG